jgi:Holliday junction resolvase RusA-like endonuclease
MTEDHIECSSGEVRGVVHGPLPNKSNSRRVVKVRGRTMVIKEKAAIAWLKAFDLAAHVPQDCNIFGANARFSLTATVYQANMRRDLDIELLCDALQRSGVIENDRAIWAKHAIREIDRDNPRVEFVLRPMEAQQ